MWTKKIENHSIIFFVFVFEKGIISISTYKPDNQVGQERVINDRDFYSLENNDRQVILAKADGNSVTPPTNRGPSNFPTTPFCDIMGRGSSPIFKITKTTNIQ